MKSDIHFTTSIEAINSVIIHIYQFDCSTVHSVMHVHIFTVWKYLVQYFPDCKGTWLQLITC